jgi:uncharacterized protein YaiL (DUF2058 family)
MAMGDFREQLLKAGLVTAEAAAAAAEPTAEARARSGGRGGRPQRPRAQESVGGRPRGDAPAGLDEAAALERERERVAMGGEAARRREKDALEIARRGRLELRGAGHHRWYFGSRRGALPWLDVPDEVAHRLGDGRAAIVEAPTGQPFAVDADAAARLEALDPRWIRLWNRRR